jgi:hypothetical protein
LKASAIGWSRNALGYSFDQPTNSSDSLIRWGKSPTNCPLSLSLSLSILFSSFARDFFYRRVCACVSDVEKEEEEEEEGEDCV